MSQKLSIILRGHIRNSFNDKTIYNYIKQLANEYDLKIYIQTWNILQSDVSWRHMEKNESRVTESLFYEYFADLSTRIQKIIILDDTKINLLGKTTGRMGKTAGSYLGWKRMWYGIYEIAGYLKTVDPELDHFVINTRFDVFNNSVSFLLNSINDKLKNVMNSNINPSSISKNIFLKDVEFFGMDNFYIGNVNTILKLSERFNYQLDEIVIKHPRVTSHEFYTYHVNNTLFLGKSSGSNKNINISLIIPNPPVVDIMSNDDNIQKNETTSSNTDQIITDPDDSVASENNKISMLKSSSNVRNNKMPLFDKYDTNNPDVLVTSGINQTSTLASSSHVRNDKTPLFDNHEMNNPVVFVTSEINQTSLLTSSSHIRNNKMPLFDKYDTNNPVSLVTSEINQTPVLPQSSYVRNDKMQFFDTNETVKNTIVSSITTEINQPPVLPSSSHIRNDKMQLFHSNETLKNTIVSSITTEINQNPVLPTSSHNRNNKMALFDKNESINNTVLSIIIDDNQNQVLHASSHNRNNKMPLMDTTSSLTSSTIINATHLSTLPSASQTKNVNKMELFDSKPMSAHTLSIINNENQPVLVSTNTSRRGSLPLIDSSVKNNKNINMITSDIPILSSNSQPYRSSIPLINIDRNDKSKLNQFNGSEIVLINSNSRNNLISMVNLKERPLPVIEKPVPVIEKPVPVIEKPVPVIEKPVPKTESKYKKNEKRYISKPVPISKFSVTLDPSYLNLDNMGFVPNVLNTSDHAKLIHGNKFKTNTQSLAAYYALLSQ